MTDHTGEFPAYQPPTPDELAAEAEAVLANAPFKPGAFVLAATETEPTSDLLYQSEDVAMPDRMMLRVPMPSGLSKEELIANAHAMGEHFERLTVEYGIQTAGYGGRVVLMSDVDGSPLAAVVGDEIGGEAYELDPTAPVPEHQRSAAARLLRRLSMYYFEQLDEGGPILLDIFDIRQYRFVDGTFILADNGAKLLNRAILEPDAPVAELRAWAWSIMDDEEFSYWEVAMEGVVAKATTPASGGSLGALPPGLAGPEEG